MNTSQGQGGSSSGRVEPRTSGYDNGGRSEQSSHLRGMSDESAQHQMIRYPFSDTEESTDDLPRDASRQQGRGGDEDDSPRLQPADEAEDSEGCAEFALDEPDNALRNEQIIKSGFLMKKGERRRTWKRRWFVLRPTRLAYYKNEKEYELLKVINLADIHAIAEVELKKRRNVFGLVTRERTYYVQATSREDMEGWLRPMRQAHKLLRKPTEPRPILREASNPQPIVTEQHPSPDGLTGRMTASPPSANPPPEVPSKSEVLPDNTSQRSEVSHQGSVGTADSFLTGTTAPSTFSMQSTSVTDSIPSTILAYCPPSAPLARPAQSTNRPLPPSILRGSSYTSAGGLVASTSPTSATAPRSPPEEAMSAFSSTITATPVGPRHSEMSSSDEEADEENDSNDNIINDDKVVIQGYLEKRISNNYKKLTTQKGWKRRWFVLRNGRLFAYKNDGEYVVKRLIPLRSVLDVLEIDPQGKHHPYCFKVVLPKRQMVLCASSERELHKWVESLRQVHEIVRRHRPNKPVSE
ncbi:hypothetical protein DFS34DRAFT_460420 [Phlyctochytrium arcticum]|nr:hypothetical protein DFS34DRAFT_460420 [Phlyctochytrium arcticum]